MVDQFRLLRTTSKLFIVVTAIALLIACAYGARRNLLQQQPALGAQEVPKEANV